VSEIVSYTPPIRFFGGALAYGNIHHLPQCSIIVNEKIITSKQELLYDGKVLELMSFVLH
jgi:hypothetical protein